MINIEQLAEELHKFYRAAFKALHHGASDMPCSGSGHDHGWDHCNKKAYFRRRAENLASSDTLGNMRVEHGIALPPRFSWMRSR